MKNSRIVPRSPERLPAKSKSPGAVGALRNKEAKPPTKQADGGLNTGYAEQLASIERLWAQAAGVDDGKLGHLLVGQLSALEVWGLAETRVERLMLATAALREMKPSNLMEALLAVQMIGVHSAAVLFLKHATRDGQTSAGADASVTLAIGLMQLFADQIVTMDKLKPADKLKKDDRAANVIVEQVHVYSGGQAIVGLAEPARRSAKPLISSGAETRGR